MDLHGIAWHSIALNGTILCCMVLCSFELHYIILNGIASYLMLLHGISCHYVFHSIDVGVVCHQMVVHSFDMYNLFCIVCYWMLSHCTAITQRTLPLLMERPHVPRCVLLFVICSCKPFETVFGNIQFYLIPLCTILGHSNFHFFTIVSSLKMLFTPEVSILFTVQKQVYVT